MGCERRRAWTSCATGPQNLRNEKREARGHRAPRPLCASTEREHRQIHADYERETQRKTRLWEEVERMWAAVRRAESRWSAEKRLQGRKIRARAERLFREAEERKGCGQEAARGGRPGERHPRRPIRTASGAPARRPRALRLRRGGGVPLLAPARGQGRRLLRPADSTTPRVTTSSSPLGDLSPAAAAGGGVPRAGAGRGKPTRPRGGSRISCSGAAGERGARTGLEVETSRDVRWIAGGVAWKRSRS